LLREAVEYLPPGVESVRLRSDSAGYQWELLRYCELGRNLRFSRIARRRLFLGAGANYFWSSRRWCSSS